MLTHLAIQNFAVIESLRLDFHQGFLVFTGETGSGKSVLVEAIHQALGGRADTAMVRTGCERATIELTAESDDPRIIALLAENGLTVGDSLILSREISAAGKSQARINGTLVTVQFLNRVGRRLVDIHGQYDHQSLLDPEKHIRFLDGFAGEEVAQTLESFGELYRDYSTVSENLRRLLRSKSERLREADFMRFEWNEIEAVRPEADEDSRLEEQAALLKNHQRIADRLTAAYEHLFASDAAAIDRLGSGLRELEDLQGLSQPIDALAETARDAFYQLDELRHSLRKIREQLDYSPQSLDDVLSRLDLLEHLKRKHGGNLADVLAYRDAIAVRLAESEEDDQLTDRLKAEQERLETLLADAAEHLGTLRREAAKRLESEMDIQLAQLHFPHARLTVAFAGTDAGTKPALRENGKDIVEFLIVTNPGEPPKPLAKIASGGEISRIMLALKTVIGSLDRIPTLIFDEIDSGISGQTASVVGKKLRRISGDRQVFCITHLPQIAAGSDHHFLIRKWTDATSARTGVVPLDAAEKVREIARLTSGMEVTEAALANARELIADSLDDGAED